MRTVAAITRFTPVVQGGAAFGGLYAATDEDTVQQALQTAWDLGIRAYDTAPHYGVGLSEERMGRFLAGKPRDQFVLSTKVGRLLVDDPDAPGESDGFNGTPLRRRIRDYSADGVRRSLEESLNRLGLDHVDLALIHDPEDYLGPALGEAAPALSALRAEGVIGAYGVGTNFCSVGVKFAVETDADHVMIAGRYTLLDRSAEADLLPACAQRSVAVLAAGTFNSGLLADPSSPGAHFNYEPAPRALVARALELEEVCRRYDVSLRAAALQFPLRHPAVRAVVLGGGTAAAVADCQQQLAVTIPDELWQQLDERSAAH